MHSLAPSRRSPRLTPQPARGWCLAPADKLQRMRGGEAPSRSGGRSQWVIREEARCGVPPRNTRAGWHLFIITQPWRGVPTSPTSRGGMAPAVKARMVGIGPMVDEGTTVEVRWGNIGAVPWGTKEEAGNMGFVVAKRRRSKEVVEGKDIRLVAVVAGGAGTMGTSNGRRGVVRVAGALNNGDSPGADCYG